MRKLLVVWVLILLFTSAFALTALASPDITLSHSECNGDVWSNTVSWRSTSQVSESVDELALFWDFYESGQVLFDYGQETQYAYPTYGGSYQFPNVMLSRWNSKTYDMLPVGTWETYGYHNAWWLDYNSVRQHTGYSTYCPWHPLIVANTDSASATTLEIETSFAQAARAANSELKGWSYYPFFDKWRNGQLGGALDDFLSVNATSRSGYLAIGDFKPATFLNEAGDKVAVAIQKADGHFVIIVGSKQNEKWTRDRVIDEIDKHR